MSGADIIEGLKEAVRGDLSRVTIPHDGKSITWVRESEIEAIREKTIEQCAAALKASLADFEIRGPYENGYITAKRSAVESIRALSESVRKAKEEGK